jgi:large subunit ribosomal protein L9
MARKTHSHLVRGPRGGIQLLLTKPVAGLGQPGDVIEVAAGYARNYLLPQGLAARATPHNIRTVERHRKKAIDLAEQRRRQLEQLCKELGSRSISIEATANPEGHLYGSIGAEEISAALQKERLAVQPSMVRLEGPLKELGLYSVKVKLADDLDSEVKVWVVPGTTKT